MKKSTIREGMIAAIANSRPKVAAIERFNHENGTSKRKVEHRDNHPYTHCPVST